MITCVDLFCGVGGLTHGLSKSGVRVVAGFDVDSECRYPYEQNNTAKFIERDVREVKGNDLRRMWAEGTHSLLAGCAPCQAFSTYSRKGRKTRVDTRWDLIVDFGRLIREADPDLVTMENVPQILDHKIFKTFLASLAGYHVWHDVVECDRYRVPQARKRLVLLASKLGPITLNPLAHKGAWPRNGAGGNLPPTVIECWHVRPK